MARGRVLLLVLSFSGVACFGEDDDPRFFMGYRLDAPCSPQRTCPPEQMCDLSKICRQPCKTPGVRCVSGQPCPCAANHECDVDGLCRPACGAAGGGVSAVACGTLGRMPPCPSGEFCDSARNICRPMCIASPCPSGMTCVDASGGCRLCKPGS